MKRLTIVFIGLLLSASAFGTNPIDFSELKGRVKPNEFIRIYAKRIPNYTVVSINDLDSNTDIELTVREGISYAVTKLCNPATVSAEEYKYYLCFSRNKD